MNKKALVNFFFKFPGCLAVWGVIIGFPLLIIMGLKNQKEMYAGLPPQVRVESREDAVKATIGHGNIPSLVVGTGSMYPYIDKAPEGSDPLTTVMAVAELDRDFSYSDIKKGDLIVYKNPRNHSMMIIHQAAQKDSLGWIMTGLNKKNATETFWRVTEDNYVGKVVTTYVWK